MTPRSDALFMRYAIVMLLVTIVRGAYLEPVAAVEVDDYGGRHPGLIVGVDGLPFIIYLSDTRGSVGMAHCEDVLCRNMTKRYLDGGLAGDGNQNSLRVSPTTGYPQFVYSLNVSDEYHLLLATCHDAACTAPSVTTLHTFTNHNADNFYVDFSYDPFTTLPVIVCNSDPTGLYLIVCSTADCSKVTPPQPLDTRQPYTGWYPHIEWLDNGHTLMVTYYCNTTFEVQYMSAQYPGLDHVHYGVVSASHGGWVTTARTMSGLGLTYVDLLGNGTYHYCGCEVVGGAPNTLDNCACTQIDSGMGIGYDLWVYPDLEVLKGFGDYPVTSYFHGNQLKVAQCDTQECAAPLVQVISTGKFGYGRDSKLVWNDKLQVLYIPFLDYDGNGGNKKCRLAVMKKEQ